MATNDELKAILEERGKQYGRFKVQAQISLNIKEAMFRWPLLAVALAPDQREALEIIAHKIARIINGNPNYIDSWVDIAGYATLVADRLRKEQSGDSTT